MAATPCELPAARSTDARQRMGLRVDVAEPRALARPLNQMRQSTIGKGGQQHIRPVAAGKLAQQRNQSEGCIGEGHDMADPVPFGEALLQLRLQRTAIGEPAPVQNFPEADRKTDRSGA